MLRSAALLKAVACLLMWMRQRRRILSEAPRQTLCCSEVELPAHYEEKCTPTKPNYIHAFSKTNFFFTLASPLINKTNAGHLGMSKRESLPKMLQDALPYPLPVITPIWEASHSRGIHPFPDSLSSVHTFGYSHLTESQILSVLMSTAAASAMVISNLFLLWL